MRNAITTMLNVKYIRFWTPQNRPGGPEAINGPKLPGLPQGFDVIWEAWYFGVFWGVKRGPWGCQKQCKIPDLSTLGAIKHEFFGFPILLKGLFLRGSIAFCNRLSGRKIVDLGKRLAFCRVVVLYVPNVYFSETRVLSEGVLRNAPKREF